MDRSPIFAHYNRDAVIDEYVPYYLRGLKEEARILFVSDAALPRSEAGKLEGLAELVSASPSRWVRSRELETWHRLSGVSALQG